MSHVGVNRADALAMVGRSFFAVAMVAFGVQGFVYGDFVAGRAPAWPPTIPGRLVWAWLSGGIFIAAGAVIIAQRRARAAAFLLATMIFFWALVRHLPLVAASPRYGLLWTNAGKALALGGGALAVAGSLPGGTRGARLMLVGGVCFAAFLIQSGIQHFIYPEFVSMLVPAWIPGASFWTYFAGAALIAGGAGLLLEKTAHLAAVLTGSMIFLWLLLLHIPRGMADPSPNELTAVVEALAMSGIAFVLVARPTRTEQA